MGDSGTCMAGDRAGYVASHAECGSRDLSGDALTNHPGTYALVLVPAGEQTVKIGKLGLLQVRCGFYVYIGSAFGPGGLGARIAHHQRISNRPRWHIDYLRPAAEIAELWYTHDCEHREHQWAKIIAGAGSAIIPLPGFGSSDCTCKSHLYFFKSKPCGDSFCRCLHTKLLDHGEVLVMRLKQ